MIQVISIQLSTNIPPYRAEAAARLNTGDTSGVHASERIRPSVSFTACAHREYVTSGRCTTAYSGELSPACSACAKLESSKGYARTSNTGVITAQELLKNINTYDTSRRKCIIGVRTSNTREPTDRHAVSVQMRNDSANETMLYEIPWITPVAAVIAFSTYSILSCRTGTITPFSTPFQKYTHAFQSGTIA